MNIFQIP